MIYIDTTLTSIQKKDHIESFLGKWRLNWTTQRNRM